MMNCFPAVAVILERRITDEVLRPKLVLKVIHVAMNHFAEEAIKKLQRQ
jgi:hypothetical protein